MKRIKNFYYRYKDSFDFSFYWVSLLILVIAPYSFYQGGDYFIWGDGNWSLVFISLAGIMKAVMDVVQFHYWDSILYTRKEKWHLFFNPEISWKNKYSDAKGTIRKKLFKIIPTPVFFTDAWHLFQSFQINFIILAVVNYTPTYHIVIDFVVLSFLYRAFFFLFYKYFLIKK